MSDIQQVNSAFAPSAPASYSLTGPAVIRDREALDVLETYRHDGFVVIRGAFSEFNVERLRSEADRIIADPINDPKNIRTLHQKNSGLRPERIDPVVDISPVFAELASSPQIISLVEALIGERAVLFKDKLILKYSGTEGYPMHQDYAWWKHIIANPNHVLSVSIALDHSNAANGSLNFKYGCHHALIAENRDLNGAEAAGLQTQKGTAIDMKPGDVVLFHSLAPHWSEVNQSPDSRRALYLTYAAASYGDLRESYYRYYVKREGATRSSDNFFK